MTYLTIEKSGFFRRGNEGVFAGDRCIFIAPPPHMVPELMQDLFNWMKNNQEKIHPLILSAVFHYEFVFIHSFSDGNGRMARLWHTTLLYNWRPMFAYIPLESQIEKYQEEYYEAIAKCNAAGNSDFFIEFILDMIDQILTNVLKRIHKANAGVSEYVKKLLDVMEYDVPYPTMMLMKALGLKSVNFP